MDEKKAPSPTKERAQADITYSPIIAKHAARFNNQGFKEKPDKSQVSTFNAIHRDLKDAEDMQLTIQEILEVVTRGYCIKLGAFKTPDYTPDEQSELKELYRENFTAYEARKAEINRAKQIELAYTDLAILDVDDRTGATDMQAVFEYSGAIGLYRSFSHGKISEAFRTKQNSYKLIFALDAAINNEDLLKHIQTGIQRDLYNKFPQLLPIEGVKRGNNGIDVKGTGFFYGTNQRGYLINENPRIIKVAPHIAEYEAEKELRAYAASLSKINRTGLNTTDKEALEMAEFLGDISGLEFNQWITLAIGLFNSAQAGTITEDTALEILKTLDGNAQNERFYMQYKRPLTDRGATASIATFIKLATDRGFKRKIADKFPGIEDCNEPEIKTEIIKQKTKHIPAQVIGDILTCSDRKILLISDTNSGKTFATVNACKAYLKEHSGAFVYFAAPTRALGGQVASKYGLGRSLQDEQQAGLFVKRAIENNSRIICGTYDKAAKVLKALPADLNLIVIADEAHKEVTDYQLRHTAIRQLFDIADNERVIKFIGLTGTPQEIDLTHYDKRCIIQRQKRTDIAKELLFVEYNTEKGYTNLIARSIAKEVSSGAKVLAFVNNKAEIEHIRQALKKADIKAVAVTADNRKSNAYNSLLKAEKMPENVQVILATVAIADGINIVNGPDYVCIIAPSRNTAPFYNISLIKQASNRFRNTYKRLVIPVFIRLELEDERKTERQNHLESRYQWLMMDANYTRKVIKERFEGRLDLYKPSIAEAISGLFNTGLAANFDFKAAYKEIEKQRRGLPHNPSIIEQFDRIQERLLTVDERAKRYQASQDQEAYYKYYPFAFKRAIMDVTAIKEVKHVFALDYLADEAEDEKKAILDELQRLEEQAALEAQEKREKVAEILTEPVFNKLQNEFYSTGKVNEANELWQAIKKAMHKDHAAALKGFIGFVTYEQAIKELQRIKKPAQVYELRNHLKNYADLQAFKTSDAAGAKNLTQTIIGWIDLALSDNRTLTAGDREHLISEIAKEFKGAKAKEKVASTFKAFFAQHAQRSTRIGGVKSKISDYRLLDMDFIAGYHTFSPDEIEAMQQKRRYNLNIKG